MSLKNKILKKLANFDIFASLRDDINSADQKVKDGLQEFLQDEDVAMKRQQEDLKNKVQPADISIYDWYEDKVEYEGTYVRQNKPLLSDKPKFGFVKGYEVIRNGHNELTVVCLFYEITNEKTGEYSTTATGYSKRYDVGSIQKSLERGIVNQKDGRQYILSKRPTDSFSDFKENVKREMIEEAEKTDKEKYKNRKL